MIVPQYYSKSTLKQLRSAQYRETVKRRTKRFEDNQGVIALAQELALEDEAKALERYQETRD